MRRLVYDETFNNKILSLNLYKDAMVESIDEFYEKFIEVCEVIEAIKICANTYGGYKHVATLSNIDFMDNTLNEIKEKVSDIKIIHKNHTYIFSEKELRGEK